MEVALILVFGIQTGIRICAHEIATGHSRLEQGDIVDVGTGRFGGIENIRHVYEDGDVLAHK